jgi:hypothetical protein
MARKYSVARRNARLAADETTIGTGPILKFFTGSPPADCAAANSGTELVSMTLPSDWLGAPSSGAAAKAGTWQGTAGGTGTAGHYRLYASDGTTCHEQGTITATGGGGDMTIDNTSIASGQTVTVTGFTLTAFGA